MPSKTQEKRQSSSSTEEQILPTHLQQQSRPPPRLLLFGLTPPLSHQNQTGCSAHQTVCQFLPTLATFVCHHQGYFDLSVTTTTTVTFDRPRRCVNGIYTCSHIRVVPFSRGYVPNRENKTNEQPKKRTKEET